MGEMADMCLESHSEYHEAHCSGPNRTSKTFKKDELFYHAHYPTASRIHETANAVLFEDEQGKFWYPKKLIKQDNYIWDQFTPVYIKD